MKKNWVELYKKYGIYILLVVVFAFFAVAAPNFLAAKNVINILRQVSMFGIVVVGVCMVMIGGGMDLSVGMQMAVDGMLIGYMMVNLNVPIPLAIVITIVVGCLLGAANGIIAVKMHIAPIIVTLGTMLVLQGVAYLITGGYPITGMPEAFKVIGQGYVGIIPVPVIIFVLFIIFGAILMNKTYLGRYIYALGGNKEAARLAGINVDKLTVAVYTFCGFCASIAALIMVGRTNAAQPGAGSSYSFDCMTAACLGGVSIAGGEGKISDYTYEELQQFHLCDSVEKIPKFEDVLKMVDGKVPLIVEFKIERTDLSLCPLADKMLRAYKGMYCMESFNPLGVWWYRKKHPDLVRGQLSDAFLKEGEYVGILYFVLQNLLLNFVTKPDFVAYNHHYPEILSRKLCRGLYHNTAAAWTIKSQKELDEARKHFDIFIFDSFVPEAGK